MKNSFLLFWFLPPTFFFYGCGSASSETPETPHRILLRLKLPDALEKKGPAYQEFLKRADSIELNVEGREGQKYDGSFSPPHWEKISLPELDFPKNEKDALTIKVRIWDRTQEGIKRETPVLLGESKIDAKEIHSENTTEVRVVLHLQQELFR